MDRVDRVVWLNLSSRLDRRLRVERELASSRLVCGAGEVQRHEPTLPSRLLVPSSFREHPGHYSCRRAHLDVIERGWADRCETLLIFEDDVLLDEDFDQRAQDAIAALPQDWYMLYFGGVHQAAPMPYRGSLRVSRGTTTTCAYLLSRSGMEACIDAAAMEYPRNSVDHAFMYMHQALAERQQLRCFAVHPWIVYTADDHSDLLGGWTRGHRFWEEQRQEGDRDRTQKLRERLARADGAE